MNTFNIDFSTLLGRENSNSLIDYSFPDIKGNNVLVTGAGGSIGSSLCKQIILQEPSTIILIENSELNLYNIYESLTSILEKNNKIHAAIVPLLASVLDKSHMENIISHWKPRVIFHAAAYKHVHLVEQNISAGIKNNVIGTLYTAELAAKYKTKQFILISSDKAINPVNIMGASKRLAEIFTLSLANQSPLTTFSVVRFGNIIGSSGSVVPKFIDQINNGEAVTLTDDRVTRYFMTADEAVKLLLEITILSAVSGGTYGFDMGEPVSIFDLAKKLISLSGKTLRNKNTLAGEIEIKIIGLRPYEKMHEESIITKNAKITKHPKIYKTEEDALDFSTLQKIFFSLTSEIEKNSIENIKKILIGVIPELLLQD